MPTFLSDPTPTAYLALVVVAVIAAAIWYRSRSRKSRAVAVVAVAALAAVIAIDWLVERPREEAVRRVEAMAEAATAVATDRFVEHLSASFTYQGANRERVRTSGAWRLIREHQARIAAWGFGHDDTEYHGANEVEIGFYAKAQTPRSGALLRYVRATFVRDPDGQFRLKTMEFYTPGALNARSPDPVPGFP